ncbi:uncharacterized protein LOC122360167 [Puntigrus tetrazona]|uniref:uncharacterized protein LOC122360167 n=1 Tax=Puntigrus tetrazona TaxID=1606681 RepID=UPI001C89E6AB|nr:uncharacterized protein LOC122360167 [Puntigrus tetrazona]XP_043116491.1 uncharacterized protein LOC122360167 [Puntigrus tetrazona]
MAVKYHKCLGLIILCSFLTGTSRSEVTHIFSTVGENVRLPCNALSDCTSTSWNYDRLTYLETVDLIVNGKIKYNREKHERLSLGPDCSLNIKTVTKDDYGIYICQQYGHMDRQVFLHVLLVSSSSSQSEISPGSSVTLSCQLYSYDRVSCDVLVRDEGVELIWVNEAGVNLQTDPRYKISPSGHCNSSLTTTLLREDLNREWRCQVTGKIVATFTAEYTTSSTARIKTLTPLTTSTTIVQTPTTPTQPASSPMVVILVIFTVLAVLLPAVMLWVVYTKKADTKGIIDSDLLTYVTYSGIPAESMSKTII